MSDSTPDFSPPVNIETDILTKMLEDQLHTAELMLKVGNLDMVAAELQSAGETLARLRGACGTVYFNTPSIPQDVITVGGRYPEEP